MTPHTQTTLWLCAAFMVATCVGSHAALGDPTTLDDPKQGDIATPSPKDTSHFIIKTDAVPLKMGERGEARITIKSTQDFKLNDAFPWKASVSEHNGLDLTDKVFRKDTWMLQAAQATLVIPFKATLAGEQNLKALLNFSVCTEDRCEIIRAHAVQIPVTVRAE